MRQAVDTNKTAKGEILRTWALRIFLAFLLGMSLLVGFTVYTVFHYDKNIQRVDPFTSLTNRPLAVPVPKAEEPAVAINMLLVGSDSRAGANARYGDTGGERSDSMILVHLPADREKVVLVSLPRDSYVQIPSCVNQKGKTTKARKGKLNSAYSNGPSCTVATIEALSDIRIDHYAEVDFQGVIGIVNALGGVDVCVPKAVKDKESGLNLPKGTSHVNGEQALAFARARKFDPKGDLGRVERQQQLLKAMLTQVRSKNLLTSPLDLKDFLDTVTSSVKTDQDLSTKEMLSLANELKNLDASNIISKTLPVSNANFRVGRASTVKLNDKEVKELFLQVRTDTLPEQIAGPLPTPAATNTTNPDATSSGASETAAPSPSPAVGGCGQ